MANDTAVLQGTLVLTDELAERGQLVIEGGRIQEIITGEPHYRPTHDYGDAYLAPGLIDVHVHGIAGADVMDATRESLETMARRFAAHGITSWLPSTVTQSLDLTRRAIATIRDFMAHPSPGAQVLGIHLEGPWVNPAFKGMQNEAFILTPQEDTVRDLLETGGGKIVRVSLAPEVSNAETIIRLLRERGIYVSIAHTGATYEQAVDAGHLGATQVTHCFNAMTGLHHRKPGVAGAAMLLDDLYTELIPDGIHIHPAVMRLLIRVKGRERVMLVTDAMSATELADGVYRFGGHEVFVKDGQARLADGQLASSTVTLEAAVRNVVELCGVSPVDALYMASATPAEAMGLGDRKGKLIAGHDADLAVLDPSFRPVATWIAGQVFPSDS